MVGFLFKLWGIARPYKGRLILGVLAGILAGFSEAALVLAIYMVFTIVFPQTGAEEVMRSIDRIRKVLPDLGDYLARLVQSLSGTPSAGAALAVVSIIPAVLLARGVVQYLNIYLLQWVAIRAIGDLRGRLFGRLLELPLGFLGKASTGELMSRLTNDVNTLHSSLSNSLVALIKDPVTLMIFSIYLLAEQPRLTLASLVIFPVCLVPIVVYTRKLRKSTEAAQQEYASVFKTLHEGLDGVRIVKAYNLEPVVADEYVRRTRRFNSQYMRMIRAGEIPGPLIEFFGGVGAAGLLASIVLFGGGTTTPAAFMAFVFSIVLMYARIKSVIRVFHDLVRARAASSRVFELLETRSDLPEPRDPRPLRAEGADIQFDRVTFTYKESLVFDDFSLTVKSGQLVALVGPSGSGKTTLTNLLLRFYDPKAGRVLIGGTDIRDVATRDLRNQIAVVTQETILFNDTIRRNIRFGRPSATDAEVEAAARHAFAHDFIVEKPEGYDLVIGDRGGNLSGGQRQRLAIARAIVKNAPILVLDEATSALDTESERAVQLALEALMRNRTTLCIAHRLSTVQGADLIVVLDQGRIVEAGRHKDLIAKNGMYRRLYEMQFKP